METVGFKNFIQGKSCDPNFTLCEAMELYAYSLESKVEKLTKALEEYAEKCPVYSGVLNSVNFKEVPTNEIARQTLKEIKEHK